MYRGAWRATVHGTAKSQTQLSTHTLHYIMLCFITLHYITLHYITLHMYVTTASWRENSELWLHESFLSFLLPGSQMWQQSSFDLADEYNDLIGREQQYARELHPWMISWSKIPTQANSEGTITCLLSCSNCCLNELFLQVSSFSLLSCHQSDVASTILSMCDNLQRLPVFGRKSMI